MWRSPVCTHLIKTKIKETRLGYDVCFKRNISISSILLQEQGNTLAERGERWRPVRKPKTISGMGWFLLLIPITTFGLGTWQVKRRKWKLGLIEELKARTNSKPQELPLDLSELEKLEYYPIRVRGHFDHSQELYLGPRSLLLEGEAATQSSLISRSAGGQHGYYVVTPFHLADRDLTILVNRGWVPTKFKNPATRKEGQVEGEVELVGIVRLNEQRAPFMPRNQENAWFFRDLPRMAEVTGAAPVFLDATFDSTVERGPIGGQSLVTLRNEHMSYILTWYGLSLVTAFMWYRRFIHGLPAI
ncbi:surfeit locus protein 1 [Anabrus simplex]|uniref:surfeit locus protein 1 n=1 Tax=Anabrus simplex TaxID=316456 RepID=UPI0035A27717